MIPSQTVYGLWVCKAVMVVVKQLKQVTLILLSYWMNYLLWTFKLIVTCWILCLTENWFVAFYRAKRNL